MNIVKNSWRTAMQKFRMKTSLIFILTLLLTSTVILNSCQRDVDPPEMVKIATQSEIQDVKKWYDTFTYGKPQKAVIFNKKLTQSIAKNSDQNMPELNVDWSNAVVVKSGEKTIVEVPVNGNFGFTTDLEKYNKDNPNATTSLVVLTTSKGRSAYFMSVVSKPGYKEKVTYVKQPRSFNGSLIYHTLQGQLIVVQTFKDGAVIGIGTPTANRKSVSAKAPGMVTMLAAQVECITFDVYNNWSVCVQGSCDYHSEYIGSYTVCFEPIAVGPGPGGPGPGDGGGGSNPPPVVPCIPGTVSSIGPVPMALGYGVNVVDPNPIEVPTFPGDPEPPQPPAPPVPCPEPTPNTFEITNNVSNPCLFEGVNKAITANTTIKNMLNSTFGGAEYTDHAVIFHDVTDLPNDVDGATTPDNQLVFVIDLNKNTLPQRSKEYILATVYHEILHAYLFSKYPKDDVNKLIMPDQHYNMVENYMALLTGALKTAYPNISYQEAWALSWGGLQDTPFYTSKLSPQERAEIVSINDKHRKSKADSVRLGTYCN